MTVTYVNWSSSITATLSNYIQVDP